MSLVIPDDVLEATQMTEEELRREIAVMLFEKEKLTLAKAARLAGMTRIDFQRLLASRRIPIHYDVEDLERDLETLEAIDARDRRQ